MILKNLISELDLFLPNPYTADEKVTFLNKTISEIRRFGGKSEILIFEGSGRRLYPLPGGIRGENILSVDVNGREYLPKRVFERGSNFYAFQPEGFISIEPPPKNGDKVSVYFCILEPLKNLCDFESEEEFLQQEINIDPEFKYLLLYGAMADMSLATEDTEMSNNLRAEFNALKREALQGRYKKAGKYPAVREVM